jgi:hypothetical protein
VPRGTFGTKNEEMAVGCRSPCTVELYKDSESAQIIRRAGRGIWYKQTMEIHTSFWWENIKEADIFEYVGEY